MATKFLGYLVRKQNWIIEFNHESGSHYEWACSELLDKKSQTDLGCRKRVISRFFVVDGTSSSTWCI